jgi:hypothetical protein
MKVGNISNRYLVSSEIILMCCLSSLFFSTNNTLNVPSHTGHSELSFCFSRSNHLQQLCQNGQNLRSITALCTGGGEYFQSWPYSNASRDVFRAIDIDASSLRNTSSNVLEVPPVTRKPIPGIPRMFLFLRGGSTTQPTQPSPLPERMRGGLEPQPPSPQLRTPRTAGIPKASRTSRPAEAAPFSTRRDPHLRPICDACNQSAARCGPAPESCPTSTTAARQLIVALTPHPFP